MKISLKLKKKNYIISYGKILKILKQFLDLMCFFGGGGGKSMLNTLSPWGA